LSGKEVEEARAVLTMEREPLTHIAEDISESDPSDGLGVRHDDDGHINRYIKSMFPQSYISPMKNEVDMEVLPPTPSAPYKNRVTRVLEDSSPIGSLSGIVSIQNKCF